MLNTALRTSQQGVLGTAILQWDTFSLDVCHVLQFYREALAEPISHNNSLIILDHPCKFWNHLESWHIFGNFWILLRYIEDLLEIYHQGFISYHQLYSANMYNFDISISYKSSFIWFTNYKSDISHLHHFPVVSPRCVCPFFLPVVSPQCVSPFLGRSPRASLSAFPLKKSKRMETDGYKMKQVYEIEGVDSEHLEPLNSINLGVHKAS